MSAQQHSMENGRSRSALARSAQSRGQAANSRQCNAFSIEVNPNSGGDGSLSALSYAPATRRTQVVVVESRELAFRADSTHRSDSQLTNFNISVVREIGNARLRRLIAGGRHG